MFLSFSLQRARVGPGKPTDSSSSSSVCKYDSNGNQDRVKLSDFNFVMVLGKGSFGKVRSCSCLFFFMVRDENQWLESKMKPLKLVYSLLLTPFR